MTVYLGGVKKAFVTVQHSEKVLRDSFFDTILHAGAGCLLQAFLQDLKWTRQDKGP